MPMPAQLTPGSLETEQVGGVVVVRLMGRDLVEDLVIRRLGKGLARLIQELGYHRLVLDLREVQRMSSALVAHLLAAARKAGAGGGRLAVCHVQPSVAE